MNTKAETRKLSDWWNPVALGMLTAMIFLTIWLTACTSTSRNAVNSNNATPRTASSTPPPSASPPETTQNSAPTSLAEAGEFGENVYDYAKAKDWKNASVKLAALRDAVKRVRSEVRDKEKAVDQLDEYVAALERAVTAKDRQTTMRDANQVTRQVADMTAGYKLIVPVEVTKLDYYGRELEVWAEAKDANKLQAATRELRQTWDSLRPTIAAKSAPEAKKFDTLVAQVESARTPADYARVATPVLDEVDNLEKLFR